MVSMVGFTDLLDQCSDITSKEIVHIFLNTKSNFMRQSADTPSYFSAQDCIKVFLIVLQFSRLPQSIAEKRKDSP